MQRSHQVASRPLPLHNSVSVFSCSRGREIRARTFLRFPACTIGWLAAGALTSACGVGGKPTTGDASPDDASGSGLQPGSSDADGRLDAHTVREAKPRGVIDASADVHALFDSEPTDALRDSPATNARDSFEQDPTPGYDSRPLNATCVAPHRPRTSSEFALEQQFPSLPPLSQAVLALQAPNDSSRWFVLEQTGRVLVSAATPEAADRQVFLNITDRVNAEHNESGLLGMAFAPDFATTGHAYLSYTGFGSGALNLVTRLSRFTSSNGGASLSRASEKVLLELEQPDRNHNGGHIAFGPDGYLYLGLGDGGSANDPRGHGQNRETWFGSILRLDVSGEDYVIPPTNPFANGGGAPEIYAYGFRNPWRWSFDRSTGQLWLGDVGQNAYEEIDLVELGGNYGWATREGRHCLTSESCDTTALIDPIVEYPQEDGYAVVGGHVYRGDDLPSLVGTYLYADYGTRRLWALEYNPVTGEPAPHELLRTPGRFASFAEAVDGELHLLRYTDGALFKLVGATAADAATDGFPRLLTATGCVAPNDVTEWAPGVIPFDVVSSLWADGASKERAFAIPEGTSIQVDTDGDFHLPTGSVVLKTFSIGDRRVETRLLVHHEDGGWAGYAYRWNEDQSDAELATGAAVVTVAGQRHYIPSSSDCLQCHTGVAGSTLGLELAQLGGNVTYPTGRTSNQLDTLSHIGVIPGAEGLPSYASLVELAASTQVEARARSYLHTNCSNCHRPGGPGLGDLDLRFQTPLESTGACDVEPQNGDLGIQSAHIVPGAPEQSIIPRRMRSLAAVRMPPLASEQVDLDGVAAVEQWIATMPGCDAQ